MIILMREESSQREKLQVDAAAAGLGLMLHWVPDGRKAVVEENNNINRFPALLKQNNGVKEIVFTTPPYELVSREYQPENTVVRVGNVEIGGNEVILMAGPCAVESEEQLLLAARTVKECGGKVLRAGIFKPRTSPYSFQGLGVQGLRLLERVKREVGIPVISEVIDIETLEAAVGYVDILQIGARNMQNYSLLKEVGGSGLPVLLKRGMAASIDEWLLAAEYIISRGNPNVILCERGIRTYERATRNTLDLSAVPVVKSITHLPVVVDPSHAAGRASLVCPLSRAAAAVGADGLLVEMHPEPEKALCDGKQSLDPESFRSMTWQLKPIVETLGRELQVPSEGYSTPARLEHIG